MKTWLWLVFLALGLLAIILGARLDAQAHTRYNVTTFDANRVTTIGIDGEIVSMACSGTLCIVVSR